MTARRPKLEGTSDFLILRTDDSLVAALDRVHHFAARHSGPGHTLSVAVVEGQQHLICDSGAPGSGLADSVAGLN